MEEGISLVCRKTLYLGSLNSNDLPRHFISMEEVTSLVWRKSKISMQEGREVQGKSGTGIKMTLHDY